MPPEAKPPRRQHHGVGGQRPRAGGLLHPHRAHPAGRRRPRPRPRCPAPACRRPTRRARPWPRCSRMPGTQGGSGGDLDHRRRRAGPGGPPRPRPGGPQAEHGRQADGLARLEPRAQLVGQAAALGRVVEGAGVDRARRRRPAPAGPTQPTSTGRAGTAAVAAARQVLGQQGGIEVLQRAQPDDREPRHAVAQVARGHRSPARGPWAARRRRAVGSSMLRAGSPSYRRRRRQPAEPLQRLGQGLRVEPGVGVVRPLGDEAAPRAAAVASTRSGAYPRTSIVPGERWRPPTPLATTVHRRAALGQADAGGRARRGRRRPRRRASDRTVRELGGAGAPRRASPGRSSRPAPPGAPGRRRGSARGPASGSAGTCAAARRRARRRRRRRPCRMPAAR